MLGLGSKEGSWEMMATFWVQRQANDWQSDGNLSSAVTLMCCPTLTLEGSSLEMAPALDLHYPPPDHPPVPTTESLVGPFPARLKAPLQWAQKWPCSACLSRLKAPDPNYRNPSLPGLLCLLPYPQKTDSLRLTHPQLICPLG